MTADQLARERRFGRIAGIAGLIGAALFVASVFVGSSDFNSAGGASETIPAFAANNGSVLAQFLLQAIGIALFALPLMALFRAAADRSPTVRRGLIGLTVAGPLFFAASFIAYYLALNAAVDPFNAVASSLDIGSDDADSKARDILQAQSAFDIYGGLDFAGRLGLVVGIVYTALNAMRTGLMTRFWGTLSMALGVGLLLIGPSALFVFAVATSLLVAGFWPQGRPRAWDEGKAIPWPKPGESIAGTGGPEKDPEEPASPEDFEGTATEVEEEPSERPARRDNKRKRKRKSRGS
jgi:hypothetical protein